MSTLNPNHPAFDSYRRRVAGEKVLLREGQPEAGFWRLKTRTLDTVAVIMPDRNEKPWNLICHVGPERREMAVLEVWGYVAGRLVRPEVAKVVLETGKWPEAAPEPKITLSPGRPIVAGDPINERIATKVEDLIPQARGSVMGDNAEAAGIDPMIQDAETYLETAEQFFADLKGRIETPELAKTATSYREELRSLSAKLEAKRVAEKEPYLKKGREIDATYGTPRDKLDATFRKIGVPLKAYLDAEDAKARAAAEAERKRLEAEAEAKRQKAIEEARARQDEEAAKQIEQVPVAALMETPAPVAAKVQIESPRSGKKTGLKKETTYVIEDYDKVIAAVKEQSDVREAVEKAARRLAKAGVEIAGLKKVEGTKL